MLFCAISVGWILYDQRLPNGDAPRHLAASQSFADAIARGDLTEPLTAGDELGYPPLARLIGAVPLLAGLSEVDAPPIAVLLVFAPLLALGCYGVGRLSFNPTAGVLAAVFALGSPMVMQLFRVQLLDQALAAMVAVTVWAVLASDRFARTPQSVLAGVLLGVAMLVKAPAPAFVAGAVAVAIALGGWRRPRNLGLAAAATLIVAGPYYAIHLSDYLSLSNQAVVASQDPWTLSFGWTFEGERRLTLESFAWYVWTAINTQYLVPLLCLFAVGLVSALGDLRQRRYVPELLGGLVVGYLAMTLLSVHDPRYTLPLAVYVAVLATGWIATAQRRWVTIAGTACLLAIVCLNVAASTFGLLPTVKLTPLAGDEETDLIHPGALTLLDKRGFYVGEPHSDGTWRDLLDAMDREGLHSAELRFYEVPLMGTDVYGFQVAAESAHDISFPQPDPLTSHVGERLDAVIVRPQVVITTWWSPEPPPAR